MKFGTEEICVEYVEKTGAFSIEVRGVKFSSENYNAEIVFCDGKQVLFSDAYRIKAEDYSSGYGSGVYVKYYFNEATVLIGCWLEKCSGVLHFEMNVLDGAERIETVSWPSPIDMQTGREAYTVVPMRQGLLIPDASEYEATPFFERFFYSRDVAMPWWGQACDGIGYMAVVETPFDAVIDYKHEAYMPTVIGAEWKPSLGALSGCRRMQMHFFADNCDYMTFCNEYKRYLKENGLFVTLKEKMIKNPLVKELIGNTVFYTQKAYWRCEPESIYYDKEDLSNNDVVITFDEHADILEKIKKRGVERAYVHLDGWVKMGYDNQHPDILPPHDRCGGTEGFKRLYEKCKALGYLLAVHDQYRDFYTRAPSFDIEQSTFDANGNMIENYIWPGGKQTMLCQRLAGYYVRRNYEQMKQDGILPDGAYLDVFSATQPDECSHERHRVTRADGAALRNKCLNQIRNYGMIASSEEVIDCYLPYLDIVHHSPYFYNYCAEQGVPEFGVPIPLVSIIYSECIFIPWVINEYNPGVPTGESSFLHCLLGGCLAANYNDITEDKVELINIAGKLNSAVWDKEIISFKYLTDDYKVRETLFSNGIRVKADFGNNTAEIDWGNGEHQYIEVTLPQKSN